jgi:hypothetical protein
VRAEAGAGPGGGGKGRGEGAGQDQDQDQEQDQEDSEDEPEEPEPEIDVRQVIRESPLLAFAPAFPASAPALGGVQLDLGLGTPLVASQLNARGRDIVEKMLVDLWAGCGGLSTRLCVKLS